ncbi:hypothetical protein MTO96_033945 [Rhipicephalus appendiculatus]
MGRRGRATSVLFPYPQANPDGDRLKRRGQKAEQLQPQPSPRRDKAIHHRTMDRPPAGRFIWERLCHPGESSTATCLARAYRDAAELKVDEPGVYSHFCEEDITRIHCLIVGEASTPYYNGLFHFGLKLPPSIPYSAPQEYSSRLRTLIEFNSILYWKPPARSRSTYLAPDRDKGHGNPVSTQSKRSSCH